MSIGSGIFLGALLFTIVYLYKITRDRWNWRKVARRSLIALVSALALVALGVISVVVYERIPDTPQKQTGYADLRLGMTMAEVKYAKGYPTGVLENPGKETGDLLKPNAAMSDPPPFDPSKPFIREPAPPTGYRVVLPTKALKNAQRVEDYRSWEYEQADHRIDVDFDAATGMLREIACFSRHTMNCPPLLGIQDGTSEDILVQKLGKPSNQKIDGVTKKINYSDLGVWFNLEQRKVYMIGVVSTAPPCKDGSQTCNPWERDWDNTKLPPGTAVTKGGDVVQPSSPKP